MALDGLRQKLSPLVYLSNNWISRIGVVLVTTATIFWLMLLPTYLHGGESSAYLGILLFLMLPGVFFGGLVLIPLGMWVARRSRKPVTFPKLTWSDPELRKLVVFVLLASFANIVIGTNLTYRAISYMDTVEFCGTSCHSVMKPEYTAYQNSPHSRVECVKCHIGPGASWFVQSKLSGTWQLIAVTLNTYPRPIPTPVENLRPARDTCESCHWPDKYGTDRLRVIPSYTDEGELKKSVLLMKIGGGGLSGKGIHGAHIANGTVIRYAHSDKGRQTIPWVSYSRNGETREFVADGTKKDAIASMPVREMDCIDCHNRPTHAYELPERAVDRAMAAGQIPLSRKTIKKDAVEILKRTYATTTDAERDIPKAVKALYTDSGEGEKAAQAVLAIFNRNVFPEMNVKWGTYPNNIGHTDFPGCFRCHDDGHKTSAGKSISQDCNTCHVLLAMEEDQPKILEDLGGN